MKDRIKEIRKANKKTQLAFGEDLNVSKSTIEAIEYGRRDATDRMISDICRVYKVNEEWLRTGNGDMYAPKTREDEIAEMTANLFKDNSELRLRFQRVLNMATEEQLQTIYELAKMLANDEI